MKKFLYLFVVVLMMVGLIACFGSQNVAKFSLTISDATQKTVLTLTPDYSKRTLVIDYKKDFTDKKQQSSASTGQLGGDYFDRFEAMVKVVKAYKVPDGQVLDSKKANLVAMVEGKNKDVVSIQAAVDDKTKDVQDLINFYGDVVGLLMGSSPF
ncbi:hypothetical protein HZA40_04190 [Candidatus Peregrinibacteria bacterium]|nr:hypothetical protein [Candidatus Peregrinibacteria bacterium]